MRAGRRKTIQRELMRSGSGKTGPVVALWAEALLRLDFSLLRFFSSKEKK